MGSSHSYGDGKIGIQLREAGKPSLLRAINLRASFDLVHENGPIEASRIVHDTGLSQPTVREVIGQLLELGLIRKVGRTQGLRGPTAQLYDVNPGAAFVLGLDVGRQWIRAALTDVSGATVARTTQRTTESTAAGMIDQLRRVAEDLAGSAGIALAQLDQIVVGTPGRMRPGEDHLSLAPNLPSWESPTVIRDIRTALEAPVLFENDANLAAIAELVAGRARGVRDFVLLSIGTGVGMGVILDGELRRGATGLAGEIGYMALDMDGIESRPEPTWGTGAFEGMVASAGILDLAATRGLTGETAADLFEAARSGDARAQEVVAIEARRLAHAIAAVASVLDPELVILGGGIGAGAGDLLVGPIAEALATISPFAPQLAVSTLGTDGVVIGANAVGLRVALDRIFERDVAGSPAADTNRVKRALVAADR